MHDVGDCAELLRRARLLLGGECSQCRFNSFDCANVPTFFQDARLTHIMLLLRINIIVFHFA